MEKNIVVIDLNKYDNLITEIENQKNKISNLEQELEKQISERKMVNSVIYSKIYKDKSWHLKQIVDSNEDDYDYYFKTIREDFLNYGYTNEDYIKDCVKNMVQDRKIEMEKEVKDNE